MKEPCWLYMCTTLQVDILKHGRVLVFWYFENGHFFTLFPGIPHFANFQVLSDLGHSKCVLGSFFRVRDDKLT